MMIITDWLVRKRLDKEEQATKRVEEQVKEEAAARKKQLAYDRDRSKQIEWEKDRDFHRKEMRRAEAKYCLRCNRVMADVGRENAICYDCKYGKINSQNSRIIGGKLINGFGNRNLKLLDDRRVANYKAGDELEIALVDETGNDKFIPWQLWILESLFEDKKSLMFNIPRDTTVVGVLIYRKGEVIAGTRVTAQKFTYSGTYTLTVDLGIGRNH